MPKYRKKPIVVEAIRWTGDNSTEVSRFFGDAEVDFVMKTNGWMIDTLEGYMTASPGDWIIKGIQGEFYPCKPGIFVATYEEVKDA